MSGTVIDMRNASAGTTIVRAPLRVGIKRLVEAPFPPFEAAQVPAYKTDGAACFDLHAIEHGRITLGLSKAFRTGLAFEIPDGYAMLIFSRSGHGFSNDVRLANCVGVIDSDYTGEVMVKLTCDSDNELRVKPGDRIAQALLMPVPRVEFEVVDLLKDTARGARGFGSTGA